MELENDIFCLFAYELFVKVKFVRQTILLYSVQKREERKKFSAFRLLLNIVRGKKKIIINKRVLVCTLNIF